MQYSKIIATGSYLPDNIVTNLDFEKKLDTTDSWIQQRTGIKQRHFITENDSTVSMAVAAAKKTLKDAGINPSSIDLIIVATSTPDQVFPATACNVQAELGINSCAAFDLQAACSGFIYALSVADNMLCSRSGYKRALVIGTEAMSRLLDWQDRSTCVLFGDGAGAIVLEQSNVCRCIINTFNGFWRKQRHIVC